MQKPVKEVTVSFIRKYRQVEHTCPVCDSVFQGSPLAVYCSDLCRRKAAWERNGGRVNERRKKERQEKSEGKQP